MHELKSQIISLFSFLSDSGAQADVSTAGSLHITSTLGILLGASLLAGVAAEYIRLPKVTVFLLVGLILGPSVVGLIPAQHVDSFDPMLKLAMGLVLFSLGSQFPVRRVKRMLPRAFAMAVGDLVGTFVFVTLGLVCLGQGGRVSLLLGCLALATAPATTVLVLRDLRAEGPVTDSCGLLVAINNLASIVAFELAFLIMQAIDGGGSSSIWGQFGSLVWELGGAVVLGIVAGIFISYGCGMMHTRRWLALLVAATTIVLGVSETFSMPYMLTFLFAGLTVANLSETVDRIKEELNQLTGLLSVLFFAVHGAELDLRAFLAAGLIGGAYIVLRSAGKFCGVYFGAKLAKRPDELRLWVGPSLLAQAGAAIALSTIAADRMPELGRPVQTIILGSVVVFEIIGPLLIRFSLLRAGEIPIASAIGHTDRGSLEEFRDMWDSLRMQLGWVLTGKAATSDLTIEPLIRRTVQGVDESSSFADVVSYIEHSHDNAYPVIDSDRAVIGIIRYQQLREVMFDPVVAELVRAEDLASPTNTVLYADETVDRASKLFHTVADDCIPVIDREAPHALQGIVRRSDVMHIMIRRRERS